MKMAPRTRGRFLLTALLLVFLPMAFSDDIADAMGIGPDRAGIWGVLWVDAFLLLVTTTAAWLAGRPGNVAAKLQAWEVYATGALLMVGLDVQDALTQRYDAEGDAIPRHFLAGLALSFGFVLFLLAMSTAIVVIGGRRWRASVASLLPLAVGTFAAYTGAGAWEAITQEVRGEVDKEYFAQLSQIIPLLLIAIAFEAQYLRQLARSVAGRAIATVTIVMLCLGEALALTVLPVPVPDQLSPSDLLALQQLGKQPPATQLGEFAGWHGYFAFILSLQASFIALILLLKALVWNLDRVKAALESRRRTVEPAATAEHEDADALDPPQQRGPGRAPDALADSA